MAEQNSGVSVYKNLEVESKVAEASPHELIQMLYDEAHVALLRAKARHEEENRTDAQAHIQKAIDIVTYLLQSLSLDVESELPHNLSNLYEYMIRQLLSYRINNRLELIEEVDNLLETISSGWRQISGASST